MDSVTDVARNSCHIHIAHYQSDLASVPENRTSSLFRRVSCKIVYKDSIISVS